MATLSRQFKDRVVKKKEGKFNGSDWESGQSQVLGGDELMRGWWGVGGLLMQSMSRARFPTDFVSSFTSAIISCSPPTRPAGRLTLQSLIPPISTQALAISILRAHLPRSQHNPRPTHPPLPIPWTSSTKKRTVLPQWKSSTTSSPSVIVSTLPFPILPHFLILLSRRGICCQAHARLGS